LSRDDRAKIACSATCPVDAVIEEKDKDYFRLRGLPLSLVEAWLWTN